MRRNEKEIEREGGERERDKETGEGERVRQVLIGDYGYVKSESSV